MAFRIRTAHHTSPLLYVHRVHGTCYLSFVTYDKRENALEFEDAPFAEQWCSTLQSMTPMELVVEPISQEH